MEEIDLGFFWLFCGGGNFKKRCLGGNIGTREGGRGDGIPQPLSASVCILELNLLEEFQIHDSLGQSSRLLKAEISDLYDTANVINYIKIEIFKLCKQVICSMD